MVDAGVMHASGTGSAPRRLRLLSCNILAGAHIGRYRHYVTRVAQQVLPSPTKQANLDQLAAMIQAYDVVGLQEADAGSLRSGFLNQTQYLAQAAGMPYWSDQPNRRVARMAASSNGLISRLQPDAVLDYPLPGRIPGRGALLARYGSGDSALAIVIAHLSLGAQSRARQFGFLAELLSDYPNAVLMGDFNCEVDSPELGVLFQRTALQHPAGPTLTFPSWHPRRAIDHILVTAGIVKERVWTPPTAFSDHLPIAAELRLPASIDLTAHA